MFIGINTNWNGKGLTVDGELLSAFLVGLGHETDHVQFDQPSERKFDVLISLEVVNESFFSLAPKQIFVPNLEWLKPETLIHARKFDRIWAKTRDAERVLRDKFPQVTYTGFLSRDRRLPSPARERRFLHVGGDSGLKNTNAVLAAWRQWRWWTGELNSPLTVISRSIQTEVTDTPGVTFLKEVGDEELQKLQNECMFHLQPSAYEGWGHAVRESQSVGAVLLTTRGGPMAELHAPFEVDPVSDRKVCMATAYTVSGREIREKVGRMIEQPSHMIAKYQVDARAGWERMERESRERIGEAVEEVSRPVRVYSTPESVTPGGVKVAVYGNLHPEHSTENEWRIAFETLGYKVITFQENEDKPEDVLAKCIEEEVSIFLFIHTHGYQSPGVLSQLALVDGLRENGIKTVSPHLDLYFGLHGDRRDENVGKHASWKVDYCMTADGSPESARKFQERGVNHIWMKPGVNAKACYYGEAQSEFKHILVGFTGQKSYHSEWSWRPQMVEALESKYKDKFQVFSGYRGDSLNNLYASIPIWVGDCCFAGRPNYFSDRATESCGRGAFLVHPQVKGLCIPTATYLPEDILDLFDKIDYYLAHSVERELITKAAHEHVMAHDTYTHRAKQILETAL